MIKHCDSASRWVGLLAGLTLTACTTVSQTDISYAEALLAEWGTATASSPILSRKKDHYKFNLKKDADSFYATAKSEINAGIARHTQRVTSVLLAGSTQANSVSKGLFDAQKQKFSAVQTAALSDNEKSRIDNEQKFLMEQARLNYGICLNAADSELAIAATLQDTDKISALNSQALARRNGCFSEYLNRIAPQSPAADTLHPGLPEDNVPALSRIQSLPFQAKEALLTPYSTNDISGLSGSPALPDHEAIAQAATNNFHKAMFTTLGGENVGNALFGVAMVSVNPGWRTRQNYKAVVNIQPQLIYKRATRKTTLNYLKDSTVPAELRAAIAYQVGEGCEEKNLAPLCKNHEALLHSLKTNWQHDSHADVVSNPSAVTVTAISPVSYGQTLDLKNRQLTQLHLTTMLAAALQNAGLEKAAEFYVDFSKQQRLDFASRNKRNNVNVFSHGNSVIGIEVGPEFLAAAAGREGSAWRLQRQTIPVLLAIDIVDEKDDHYRPIFVKSCKPHDDLEHYCLLEPKLQFVNTHRWLPIDKNRFNIPFLPERKLLSTKQLTDVQKTLRNACGEEPKDTGRQNNQFLQARCNELRAKLLGHYNYSSLPILAQAKPKPAIQHIYPDKVTLAVADGKVKPKQVRFIVSGSDLRTLAAGDNTDITGQIAPYFDGQAVEAAALVGDSIVIDMRITDNKGPVMFKIGYEGGSINSGTSPATLAQVLTKVSSQGPNEVQYVIKSDAIGAELTLPPGQRDLPEQVGKLLQTIHTPPNPATGVVALPGTCAYLVTQKPNLVTQLGDCTAGTDERAPEYLSPIHSESAKTDLVTQE
ncbi:hypothetical protein FKG94_10000 [Exilibacterium tricleocarpae]|uniref:Uncharacterized protein n=1 Tax=Exilibacterium tricleocarpae TaxID=2591008 RepID=A0A545TUY7_9GAMM|nr:hypothetical protein [Exilibacterium tricleocarpae]TQV81019.1 hypothetical protein FKG94_10000 [Exilibacterium tricleocarpae]